MATVMRAARVGGGGAGGRGGVGMLLVMMLAIAMAIGGGVEASMLLRRGQHAVHEMRDHVGRVHEQTKQQTTTVRAPETAQQADCMLRQMVLTAATMIQPDQPTANWTALANSALRLDTQCASVNVPPTPAPRRDNNDGHHRVDISAGSCSVSFYVAPNGLDTNDGSFDAPFATLPHAVAVTRIQRMLDPTLTSPCIYLRAGTYYLGETPLNQMPTPTTTGAKDSQFGAIDLLYSDSGLTIASYPGESATLSGGARITPTWQVYAKTGAGTIYSTPLTPTNPTTVLRTDAFHLNEMFVDGARSVRAKWPNGDPSTHGLYSADTGYDGSSMKWLQPFPRGDAQEIHVAQPMLPNLVFGTFQTAIDGAAAVYDPPRSFWAMANPPGGAGATFIVPSGMDTTKTDLAARAANWSNPSTGYVHAFHGGKWANWVFSIDTFDKSTQQLHFSEGGFQDGRGWSYGGPFYVEWLIEELDAPNEWFFDDSTNTLYFMPNNTAPPSEFVVSQLPCILSAHGTADAPVANVVLSDLTLSHSSNTMMRKFEVPSGGDWSVHRGATLYLTGTADFVVQGSVFSYLGSTGMAISNWNLRTVVLENEFVWGCDSGIIVLGSIPGVDEVSNTDQPTLVTIEHNLFHELGIIIKQSAPVLISLSRSITVSRNLIFNIPRAGVNVNDAFYGNHTLSGNVMFNTVRETGDHGPINSWDRLPVEVRVVNETTGEMMHTMNPVVTSITRNLLFNAYTSTWPIDHDDGSRLYDDSFNVLVYGGAKNYLGNSKWTHDSLFIYPDGTRFDAVEQPTEAHKWLWGAVQEESDAPADSLAAHRVGDADWGTQCAQTFAPALNQSGWNERYYSNTCALWALTQPYRLENCVIGKMTDIVPYFANNVLYFATASDAAQIPCTYANGTSVSLTLAEFQALGYDLGTTQGVAPSTADLVAQAMTVLFP